MHASTSSSLPLTKCKCSAWKGLLRFMLLTACVLPFLLGSFLLFVSSSHSDNQHYAQQEIESFTVPLSNLVPCADMEPHRSSLHLFTDKYYYRSTDTIHFSVHLFHLFTKLPRFIPLSSSSSSTYSISMWTARMENLYFSVELRSTKGEVVVEGQMHSDGLVGAKESKWSTSTHAMGGSLALSSVPSLSGGDYDLCVYSAAPSYHTLLSTTSSSHAICRSVTLLGTDFHQPRVALQLDFLRPATFRAGDTVKVWVSARRMTDHSPLSSSSSTTTCELNAVVDGVTLFPRPLQLTLSKEGEAVGEFQLPAVISSDDANLVSVTVSDGGGDVESVQRVLPILLLRPLRLQLFTESTAATVALVVGINNTLYIETRHMKTDEPVDVDLELVSVPVHFSKYLTSFSSSAGPHFNGVALCSSPPPRFETRLAPAHLLSLPSSVAGDEAIHVVDTVSTVHEGRTRLTFIPEDTTQQQEGQSDTDVRFYALRVIRPAAPSIPSATASVLPPSILYLLPCIDRTGVVLHALSDRFSVNDPLRMRVSVRWNELQRQQQRPQPDLMSKWSHVKLVVTMKEMKVAESIIAQPAPVPADDNKQMYQVYTEDVSLPLPVWVHGILTVTVFSADDLPVAERLVFRIWDTVQHNLHIDMKLVRTDAVLATAASNAVGVMSTQQVDDFFIQLNHSDNNRSVFLPSTHVYTPGTNVSVMLLTTISSSLQPDERVPVSASLRLGVTDESGIHLKIQRKRPPRLTPSVYLEHEVLRVEDSEVYLNTSSLVRLPNGVEVPPSVCLDLLLGVQGWRRFAFHSVDGFLADGSAYKEKAAQVIAKVPFIAYLHDDGTCLHRNRPARWSSSASSATQTSFMMDEMDEAPLIYNALAPEAVTRSFARASLHLGAAAPPPQPPPPHPPQANVELPPAALFVNLDAKEDASVPGRLGIRAQKRVGNFRPPPPAFERNEVAFERMYAHQVRPSRKPNTREDFTDTLFYSANIETSAAHHGAAIIQFGLSDAITRFRLEVDGHVMPMHPPTDSSPSPSSSPSSSSPPKSVTPYWSDATPIGIFGSSTSYFSVSQPFFVQPKLPDSVTSGDQIHLPIVVANELDTIHLHVNIDVATQETNTTNNQGQRIIIPSPFVFPSKSQDLMPFDLGPRQRVRHILEVHTSQCPSHRAVLILSASAAATIPHSPYTPLDGIVGAAQFADSITRTLAIQPRGFPIKRFHGGVLSNQAPLRFAFEIPSDYVPSSIRSSIRLYPSPAANLMSALEALIREPCGCFEQTSATTYPLIMALQYFKSHAGVDPKLIERSVKMLELGYKRLIGFETATKGFDWFGSSPGHEALTAYGLLQFLDLSSVLPGLVEPALVERTWNWLLHERQHPEKRGFLRHSLHLDTFGAAPPYITDAYIIWSLTYALSLSPSHSASHLTEQLVSHLTPQIDHLLQLVDQNNNDAYLVALAAGILFNCHHFHPNSHARALQLARQLVKSQREDGSVLDARTSITSSEGTSLVIETTALSILVWLNDDEFSGPVESAVRWLIQACQDGRFGSTQGTVLSLKALIAYDNLRAYRSRQSARVQVRVDDRPLLSTNNETSKKLAGTEIDSVLLDDIAPYVTTPGRHTVEISLDGSAELPYSVEIVYNTPKPVNSALSPLSLSLSLPSPSLIEGDSTLLSVVIAHASSSSTPSPSRSYSMVCAIIGIPAGMTVNTEHLSDLVRAARTLRQVQLNNDNDSKQTLSKNDEIEDSSVMPPSASLSAWEFLNGHHEELVLYWRGIAAGTELRINVPLIANVPGIYTAPASRVYVYYNDEHKYWVEPLAVQITPRQSIN